MALQSQSTRSDRRARMGQIPFRLDRRPNMRQGCSINPGIFMTQSSRALLLHHTMFLFNGSKFEFLWPFKVSPHDQTEGPAWANSVPFGSTAIYEARMLYKCRNSYG